MILPSDKYGLLLLADYLEEYGSSYDIVKSTAIRNNKYTLNYIDNCYDNEDGDGIGNGSGYGWGYCWIDDDGNGFGECGHHDELGFGDGLGSRSTSRSPLNIVI